jgi:hypothetical protein
MAPQERRQQMGGMEGLPGGQRLTQPQGERRRVGLAREPEMEGPPGGEAEKREHGAGSHRRQGDRQSVGATVRLASGPGWQDRRVPIHPSQPMVPQENRRPPWLNWLFLLIFLWSSWQLAGFWLQRLHG